MADEAWRQDQRFWEASGDQAALRRVIALRRRAGVSVPGRMLAARLEPARSFEAELPAMVFATCEGWSFPAAVDGDPDYVTWREGPIHRLGSTPGRVQLPPHHLWWIAPMGVLGAERFAQLKRVLSEQQVGGVSFHNRRVNLSQVSSLRELSQLGHLDLTSCSQLNGDILRKLPAGVRSLHFGAWGDLTPVDLAPLRELPELTRVHLAEQTRPRFGVWALEGLTKIPALTDLGLDGLGWLDNAALAHLERVPELARLQLSNNGKLTRTGLKTVARCCPRLMSLDLSACWRLNDNALLELLPLRELTHLALQALNMDQRVTVAGLARLAALPLRWLDLRGWFDVSAEDQAAVQAIWPDCTVLWEL